MQALSLDDWQPTGSSDDNVILGLIPQPDTLAVREIITSGKSTLQIFHIIAAIAALLCVASLIAPAKWFNKGKGTLANFQRSGILTILLGGIAFVMAWIAFAVVLINILGGKSALNDIPGISANWPGSAAHWVRPGCVPGCHSGISPLTVPCSPHRRLRTPRSRDAYDLQMRPHSSSCRLPSSTFRPSVPSSCPRTCARQIRMTQTRPCP